MEGIILILQISSQSFKNMPLSTQPIVNKIGY